MQSTQIRTRHKSVAIRESSTPLVVDVGALFSGPGSFGLAMHQASSSDVRFRQKWNIDRDADAVYTHWRNMDWPGNGAMRMINRDVRDVDFGNDGADSADVEGVDGLVIGPATDARVMHDLCEITQKAISQLSPRWFISAGVPGHGTDLASKHLQRLVDAVWRRNADSERRILERKRHVLALESDFGDERAGDRDHVDDVLDFLSTRYTLTIHVCDVANFGVPHQQYVELVIGMRQDLNASATPADHSTYDAHIPAGEALDGIPADAFNHELDSGESLPSRRRVREMLMLDRDAVAPALTATGARGRGLHWDRRYLTNRERARLYGYPDWYVFEGSRQSVRRQIVKSISPKFMHQVFAQLARNLTSISKGESIAPVES